MEPSPVKAMASLPDVSKMSGSGKLFKGVRLIKNFGVSPMPKVIKVT